jgi:mono/diheme cytochrome c family protein
MRGTVPVAALGLCSLIAACWAHPGFAGDATSATAPDKGAVLFERDIRPILRAHCLECHGADDKPKGNLDLRLRRFMVKGGDSGPAIEPGHAEKSVLLERVKSGEMPPERARISEKDIAMLLRRKTAHSGHFNLLLVLPFRSTQPKIACARRLTPSCWTK